MQFTQSQISEIFEQIQAMISSNSEKVEKTTESTNNTAKESSFVFNQTIDSESKKVIKY